MRTAAAISVVEAHKRYGRTQALRGVSLTVVPGEVRGLIGENGAGKSTLVKILSGAIPADSGDVLVQERPARFHNPKDALRAGIATIYQHRSLIPHLSVLENVELGREQVVGRLPLLRRRANESTWLALEAVELAAKAHAGVGSLSTHEQQLVAIARALSWEASVVIFDEPTVGLTLHEVEQLFRVIERLRQRETAVIYVTHRFFELNRLADSVTVMRDGEVVATLAKKDATEDRLVESMSPGSTSVARQPATERPNSRDTKVVLSISEARCSDDTFREVDFDVHAGEIVAVTGLADSGATEFCESIVGVRSMKAIGFVLADRQVKGGSPAEVLDAGIGYIPRDRSRRGLLGSMAIGQTVTISSLHRLSWPGIIRFRSDAQTARVWLDKLAVKREDERLPMQALSGGNQQRVLIARALATRPKVLVCEDPTDGVDTAGREHIYRVLRDAADAGIPVVLSTTDLSEILRLASRCVVFRSGVVHTELHAPHLDEDAILAALFGQSIRKTGQ
ncbi:MAG: sugar ABC transporter ATP-binding protein [Bacteroidota bacterium]